VPRSTALTITPLSASTPGTIIYVDVRGFLPYRVRPGAVVLDEVGAGDDQAGVVEGEHRAAPAGVVGAEQVAPVTA
jgi:hypothetical protein